MNTTEEKKFKKNNVHETKHNEKIIITIKTQIIYINKDSNIETLCGASCGN